MFRYYRLLEVLKAIGVRIVFNMIVDRLWRRRRSELSRLAASAAGRN